MIYFFKRSFISFVLCFVLAFSTTVFANDIYAPSTPEERANLSDTVEFTIEIPVKERASNGVTIVPIKCNAKFVSKILIYVTVLNESPTVPLEDVELTVWTWDQYGNETGTLDHKSLGPLGCLLSFVQPVQVDPSTLEAAIRVDAITVDGASGYTLKKIIRQQYLKNYIFEFI
ncbi:hypothetical protein AAK894_10695 [Lachnospiraceae bacterium 46-61]